MLLGAHVSSAGGLVKALDRAEAMGCESMQIFTQSPRTWRATPYSASEVEEFCRRQAESPVRALVIHAVYLINCASADSDLFGKSLKALTAALDIGDRAGATGVVLHPGSSRGAPVESAMQRVRDAVVDAIDRTERCPVLFEDTAGAGDTIGRSFKQLADLISLVVAAEPTAGDRVGVCLDSCHLFASGYDVRTSDKLESVLDEFDGVVGLDKLRCVHLNDSKTPLGSNRDRHANLGEGELGTRGIAAFLQSPKLQDLPVILEVPGRNGKGPDRADIETARRLRLDAGLGFSPHLRADGRP